MPSKSTPSQKSVVDPADAFGSAIGGIWKSMTGLNLPMQQLAQIQADYVKNAHRRLEPVAAAPADRNGGQAASHS